MSNNEWNILIHEGFSKIQIAFPQIDICESENFANPYDKRIIFISNKNKNIMARLDVNILNKTYYQVYYEICKFCEQLVVPYSVSNNILKVQPHTCVNCGASLKSGVHKCEYCGTEYW